MSLLRADTQEVNLCDLNSYFKDRFPTYDSRIPIKFDWFVERYDFGQIGKFIDEQCDTYHKYYGYLTSKQRELAYKFGLSDIFLKPNFRRYEDTKVILSRSVWNDRLTVRYLAPIGDVTDFELFVAFRPYQFVRFVAKGHMNGESSIAAVVNRSFGSEREAKKDVALRTKQLLKKAKLLKE